MRALQTDEGFALPLVIGILAVLTVVSVASFYVAGDALNQTTRTEGETAAFQIANAGIDATLQRVYKGAPINSSLNTTGTVSDGTYSITVEPLTNSEYKVTSHGVDESGFTEDIVVKFFYINLWEMVFAAGNQDSLTAGGGGFNGNCNVTGPFYVRGNVEMGGGSYITKGPFFVDGAIVRSGNAQLGSSTLPIQLYCSGAYPPPDGSRVFYANVSTAVPKIDMPRLPTDDMLAAANRAKMESIDNIMGTPSKGFGANLEANAAAPSATDYKTINPPNAGGWQRDYATGTLSYYKYVDNDLELNGSYSYTIGQATDSFGGWYGDGHYTLLDSHDDFALDSTTVPPTLYVEGTVFIDGPLTINGPIQYVGNGTLVANGDIRVNGNFHPATDSMHTMDAHHAVGLMTPGNMTLTGQSSNTMPGDPPDHSGAFYAQGILSYTNNALVVGSMIAGKIDMGNNNVHLITDPALPTFLPDGLPGRDSPILTKGAWARQ
jgi:Tfp pilus assembly protein PilX